MAWHGTRYSSLEYLDTSEERMVPGIKRVLIIDDDAVHARSLRRALHAWFDVVMTTTARSALEILTNGPLADVVICNVSLRGASGLLLHAEAVAARPELAGRFLFVTGAPLAPSEREALPAGDDLCLAKPFRARDLMVAMQPLLAS